MWIGSNLFNIFFVLGCSASITPLILTGINNFDLFTLVGSGHFALVFGLFLPNAPSHGSKEVFWCYAI